MASFAAQGLAALTPALTARILSFDLSWLSPLLIFIGVIFLLEHKQSRAPPAPQ